MKLLNPSAPAPQCVEQDAPVFGQRLWMNTINTVIHFQVPVFLKVGVFWKMLLIVLRSVLESIG